MGTETKTETVTTEPTETPESLPGISAAHPARTGAAAICIGLAFLLYGNIFLERGIELLSRADDS